MDPSKVHMVWVSPYKRTIRTFQLLFGGDDGRRIGAPHGGDDGKGMKVAGVNESMFGGGMGSVILTDRIREWDYGEYEGKTAEEIRALRRKKGLDQDGRSWEVYRDGCEGGEYVRVPVHCACRERRYLADVDLIVGPKKM